MLSTAALAIGSFANPLLVYWVLFVVVLQRGPILPCNEELSQPKVSVMRGRHVVGEARLPLKLAVMCSVHDCTAGGTDCWRVGSPPAALCCAADLTALPAAPSPLSPFVPLQESTNRRIGWALLALPVLVLLPYPFELAQAILSMQDPTPF